MLPSAASGSAFHLTLPETYFPVPDTATQTWQAKRSSLLTRLADYEFDIRDANALEEIDNWKARLDLGPQNGEDYEGYFRRHLRALVRAYIIDPNFFERNGPRTIRQDVLGRFQEECQSRNDAGDDEDR
jgi:hypothetical protein